MITRADRLAVLASGDVDGYLQAAEQAGGVEAVVDQLLRHHVAPAAAAPAGRFWEPIMREKGQPPLGNPARRL